MICYAITAYIVFYHLMHLSIDLSMYLSIESTYLLVYLCILMQSDAAHSATMLLQSVVHNLIRLCIAKCCVENAQVAAQGVLVHFLRLCQNWLQLQFAVLSQAPLGPHILKINPQNPIKNLHFPKIFPTGNPTCGINPNIFPR